MIKPIVLLSLLLLCCLPVAGAESLVLQGITLTKNDALLVVAENDAPVFSWQASKPLIPASLTKLSMAYLAIEKWGLGHRFHTDFLVDAETLWVKGYGDPFLISEELDLLVPALQAALHAKGIAQPSRLRIDNSYFSFTKVPGRSKVADPYNAPVSAVSANFNTAKLSNKNGIIVSAEAQTPLTSTANKMAYTLKKATDRVNLVNADNAQSNFAELLLAKLGWPNTEVAINQSLNGNETLLYRHQNTHSLADVLRGTLEFSNNFIANQVFLKLGDGENIDRVSFVASRDYANTALSARFGWRHHSINEGSGLSRENRLSAEQISDLLKALEPNKALFKKIKVNSKSTSVYAKTGTLTGVRSYAGYIELAPKSPGARVRNYRFVFNFNRTVAYRHRDQVLEQLITDLKRL
ncbi:MAG: D-alanyl-D-alanine carboxypeptidase/D-alanyl-D-alanine-endopeptidase (penicillin-binding protein 4) [Arenicella sp.]|jgi:D-alanyl-D-alanine carboxypeptidase/D-alanyl-D-alanine-endopeptidase (penicillin-binding protein 4)